MLVSRTRRTPLYDNPLFMGTALYFVAAFLDLHVTLAAMNNDLLMEGNPLLRSTMRWLGPELGLFAQKSTVGVAMLACAVYARRMLTQPDRAWLATAPLYVGAVGQTLAAASWVLLGYVLYL